MSALTLLEYKSSKRRQKKLTLKKPYLNFIGGVWKKSSTDRIFVNVNPANTDDVVGVFPYSGKQDVDQAVMSAEKAFDQWRKMPAPKRGEILFRSGQLLEKQKEALAKLMTREMGKPLRETRGDVQEAIDTAYYIAGEGRRLLGQTTTSELPNKLAMTVRMPIGVCGIITPWNFPIAVPSWKIYPALICGNTMVFKPAEDTPASACMFVEILEKAGVPKGVINLVHGGPSTGELIVHHPKTRLISFTGSSEVGSIIGEACGRMIKNCSMEMGGKNAQIVMDDADLDLAIEGAVWGAFGTTGQRCTATSRIIVHKDIYETFKRRLVKRAKTLRLGDGLNEKIDVGPLINKSQHQKVKAYMGVAKQDGAKLELGGGIPRGAGYKKGYFFEPTIFSEVTPNMRIAQEEIFGPVTALIRIKNLDEAVKVLNSTDYGLSSSIFTRDINKAMVAVRDIEAGLTYVNGPTIGAEVHLPFGGVKKTGNGHREAGSTVLDIFTEWKSVFVDYSGKLQKAQMDE